MKQFKILTTVFFVSISLATAQQQIDDVIKKLDSQTANYSAIAQEIWELAEMGYQEVKSSELLQKTLADAGFKINKGVAGM